MVANLRSSTPEWFSYCLKDSKVFTLDDNNLDRTCPLDYGRHQTDPKYDLGILERLPLELLSDVLVQIDLRCLTDFRRVNQRAMEIVNSICQYRTIMTHSPASLRGILSVETGSRISCQELFRTLGTAKCEECDDFGGFICVHTCRRVCFLCFCEEPRYLLLLRSEVMRQFGLERSLVASLPSIRSVPGRYSPKEYTSRTRLVLVDLEMAHRTGVAFHGSAAAMEQHVAEIELKRWGDYEKRVLRKAAGEPGPTPRRPSNAITRDGQLPNHRRFMSIVRAPWVDSSTRSVEWGFDCIGCQNRYRTRQLHWRRKYSMDTFSDHIKECGPIKDGSHHPLSNTIATN